MPQQPASSSPDADRVLILVNPKAGFCSPQARVDQLAGLLSRRGFRPEIFTDLGEVAEQTRQAQAEGRLRALVAVGGDGTVAELVNRTAPGVPLALFPAGNENLLARYLGLDASAERLCDVIAQRAILRLDAARANNRIFLLMIGCGFDAAVVQRVHNCRSGHIRSRNYLKPILHAIRTYGYPELRVYLDGKLPEDNGLDDFPTRAAEAEPSLLLRWLFAFNLPCYGGGLRLAPRANGSDGLLDVCGFRRGSLWHGLRYAATVLLRRHEGMADCTVRRVRRLRVTSSAEVPYQLDGDPGGVLPVDIEVLPGRLTLVVPKQSVPHA